MEINVSVEIVPFGQITVRIGSLFPSVGTSAATAAQKKVIYREPEETAVCTFELWNQEGRNQYIVPLTTA